MKILVTPSLSTGFKRRTVLPEKRMPIDCSNDDNRVNGLLDSNISRQQVLIPLQLHGRKSFSEKTDPVLVKTQLGNLNPKLNRTIRQFVYSLDPVNAPSDIDELKKIFNMQVIQKDLIELNKNDSPKFMINDLTSFKTLQNFGNDTTIKTDELNGNKVDQSYIIYGSENDNNSKNNVMVKMNDPLLSATSKELNGRRISLISLKTDLERSFTFNVKKDESVKNLTHYRPYPMLIKKSESIVKLYSKAKINIGINYQANVPELLIKSFAGIVDVTESQICLWNPEFLPDDYLLEKYCRLLKTRIFNCSTKSEEVGLKILNDANGKVHLAISNCLLDKNKTKNENRWTKHEFEYFYYFLKNKGKKFDVMSKNIGTKSTSECIQMYYLLKKNLLKK